MKRFQQYHPIVLFLYFVLTISITMLSTNPIVLSISFLSSLLFCSMLIGFRKTLTSILTTLPFMIVVALINPLFVHKGETILFFLNDNPVTLESILYGLGMSVMIISIIYWFKCYNLVMTSDKFIYLFGKAIPKLSLVISIVLSFVPKFKKNYREINEAQKAMGIYTSKSYFDRIKSKIRVISILITYSLESSIDTADSMRARGYGLKGRTSYSIFKWTTRDTLLISVLGLFLAANITFLVLGTMHFVYYPTMTAITADIVNILMYVEVFGLMALATILEITENLKWRYLKSKI